MLPDLILRVALGTICVVYGIDQLRDYRPWQKFVPKAMRLFQWPSLTAFWRGHAALNILLGLWLYSGMYFRIAALVAALWLLVISLVIAKNDWRVAIRDLCLAAAAAALIFL